jgi:hypothetical protein
MSINDINLRGVFEKTKKLDSVNLSGEGDYKIVDQSISQVRENPAFL